MINIDKNIPIPPANRGNKTFKYPWLTMQVGDSFPLPFANYKTHNAVSSLITHGRRVTGHKYTMRKLAEGFRIWRIE